MARLTAQDKLSLVEPVSTLQSLLFLDTAWTAAVEEAGYSDHPDVNTAEAAAERMDELLGRAVEAARQVRSTLLPNDDMLAEILEKLGTSEELSAEQRDNWQERLRKAGGPTELVVGCLTGIENAVPREREDIRAKVGELRSRGSAEGDITYGTMCELGATITVVAAACEDWPLALMTGGLTVYYCKKAGEK